MTLISSAGFPGFTRTGLRRSDSHETTRVWGPLPARDERHGGRHHRQELHVRLGGQACHVQQRLRSVSDVHHRFGPQRTVRLKCAMPEHSGGQVSGNVPDIDLAAGDVEWPPF